MRSRISFWTILMLSCLGCGDDSDEPTPEESEDPAEHACEHAGDMTKGTLITAGADPAAAPALAESEEPYLVDFDSGTRGFVALTGPTDALLFVSQADAVTALTFGTDGADELPEGAPNEFCADLVPEHFDLELAETGDYYLELTTAQPPLWLVYMSAEGHAH
jgi:hypothetical protein